jgi:hypothetical protein
MASKQHRIESLKGAEREKQDLWAKEQLLKNGGNCSAGFRWIRIPSGYMCSGQVHYVPDELLVEGLGGFMERAVRWGPYFGPFYGHENVHLIMGEIMHDIRFMGISPHTGVHPMTGMGPGRDRDLWYGGAVAGTAPWIGIDWAEGDPGYDHSH